MVKCPLDCFLVYSFLLDVEQAKIRHAPFGTFAFSDKPLRNPSEHSDFWYIQGRIFSSCGLSETQGLPRSLVRFRAHRGDCSNISGRSSINCFKSLLFICFWLHCWAINLQKQGCFSVRLVQDWYRSGTKSSYCFVLVVTYTCLKKRSRNIVFLL